MKKIENISNNVIFNFLNMFTKHMVSKFNSKYLFQITLVYFKNKKKNSISCNIYADHCMTVRNTKEHKKVELQKTHKQRKIHTCIFQILNWQDLVPPY